MPTLTIVRIEVTAADILHSVRGCCTDCAVARAAARVLPPAHDGMPVNVSTSFLSFGPWERRQTVRLPEWVGDWIAAHDAGVVRDPIAFEIEVES